MSYRLEDWKAGITPPKGWDVADCVADGWTKEQIDEFMRLAVRPYVRREPEPSPAPAPAAPVEQMRTTEQAKPAVVHDYSVIMDAFTAGYKMDTRKEMPFPKLATNWGHFLENHPSMIGVLRFDHFKQCVLLEARPPWYKGDAPWAPRPVRDTDYVEMVYMLERNDLTPTPTSIVPVVNAVAGRHAFDSLSDYLGGLVWDGVARVDRFCADYLGAVPGVYASTVGRLFLISAVARGASPGTKVDTMIILEGAQGLRKSTALRALFGASFFTDEISEVGSKDAMIEMGGVWGLEVAEMHRFNAAETSAVKKFLSRQTDRFRPPYGKNVVEVPRRSVLAGTINPEGNGYLKDPTGARRFWPIACGKIDIDAIERDRDQIWAEALVLHSAGVPHWVQGVEQELVEAEQFRRTDVDIWTDAIAETVTARGDVSMKELIAAVGVPMKDANQFHSARIGRIMMTLGFDRVQKQVGQSMRTFFVRSLDIKEEELPGDW